MTASFDYVVDNNEMDKFSSDSSWNVRELRNTVSAGAASNKVLDAQSTVESSNIQGKNILMTVEESVGENLEDIVLFVPDSGFVQMTDEY